MATRSHRDILFQGPGGYRGSRPFESYKAPYGNQALNNFGVPQGTSIPDIVSGNRPPSIEQQSNLATGKTSGKVRKVTSLGMNGYTPASNFDLNPGGMNYDSTYTDISQTAGAPVSTQSTNQGQVNSPQLMLSPTGQYQQIIVPLPKPKVQAHQDTKTTTATKKKSTKRPAYADSEYLSEVKALERELTDYKAKMGLNRTRAGTQHSLSSRDLRQQKDRDLDELKNDFAARGIVLSGVYGDKLGEYNTLWGQQSSELDRQYKDALTDIQNQYKDYLREVGVQKEQARLAAIRRRAQKLGKL